MKILSIVVPSYNAETFLAKCIDTLLESGGGIEILIINDGSTDKTGEVAETYVKKNPSKIKVIHQENIGHGGAVNTGISHAIGKYIKVIDSDDCVNPIVLKSIVKQLKEFIKKDEKVDMVISNFMYDKKGVKHKKVMHYRNIIPEGKIIHWKDIGRFGASKYILMHSVIYSLDILKRCKLVLPEHTFYVDNLFVYLPLPYVDTLFYMDECLYHYFIGRDEQSVNEKNMIQRIDQQLAVNKLMISSVNLKAIKEQSKKRYMMHFINIVTTVTTVILFRTGTEEAMDKKKDLWRYIREYDTYLFFRMRSSLLGSIINLPGVSGRKLSLFAYEKARQKVGFN